MADRSGGSFGNEISPVNIQLTDEEKAVLKECRTNSLFFRGIPLGLLAAIVTRQIVNRGYLPHVKRFSSIYYPAIFGAGLVVGIASYRQKCFEKIMKLEHSTLADQVRDFYSKAGIPYEKPVGVSLDHHKHSSIKGGENFQESSSLQTGTSGTTTSWQPGAVHPSMETSSQEPFQGGGGEALVMPSQLYEESKQDTKHTTYEELRQKHRARLQPTFQHEAKINPSTFGQRSEKQHPSDNHKFPPLGRIPANQENRSSSHESQQSEELPYSQKLRGSSPVRKNKYGDVIE